MDDQQRAIETLIAERDGLKEHCKRLQGLLENVGYPPGHFYSPIVDVLEPHAIAAVRNRTRASLPAGVAIDTGKMTSMLRRLADHHTRFPFPRYKDSEYRFYLDNPAFGCHDAAVLFSMLLEANPRRVIEVGCGHSSSLLLDTNERFFNNSLDLTLVDPSINTIKALFGERGAPNARLVEKVVQDIPLNVFEGLEANDILFLDSSHVSKTGSDVNYYLFEVLPALRPGVLIHIHDILYPFEYLEEWVLTEKRSWNESYLLHAFLQYNGAFEIVYWNNFVSHRLRDELAAAMPLCLENEGGSIWLRRVS